MKMNNVHNTNTSKYILSIVTAVLMAGAGLFFVNVQIKENLSTATCNTLEEIMEQQAFNFASKIESEENLIASIADVIVPKNGNLTEIHVSLLNTLVEDSNFEYLFVAEKNGRAFGSANAIFHVTGHPYFEKALRGETFISNPFMWPITNVSIIAISTPLYHNKEIIGVFFGIYSASALNKLFLSSFSGNGYAYVTDSQGEIIAQAKNNYTITTATNLFVDWIVANFYANDTFPTVLDKLAQKQTGHSKYRLAEQNRLMHYTAIPINDWYIFSIVPDEVISAPANKIINMVAVLSLAISLLSVSVMLAFGKVQKKHLQQLADMAFVDELTGGPTLAKFKIEALRLINENPEKQYILVKTDIDRFKLINQTFGFEAGNRVIINAAKAMAISTIVGKETSARVNIDEFMILHEYHTEEHLFDQRKIFLTAFTKLMGKEFSYEIAFPTGQYILKSDDKQDINAAIEKVNVAHKRAKQKGVEICVYDEAIFKEAIDIKNIENKMGKALKSGEFKLFLQPKRFLKDESLAGAEALARWYVNDKFVMSPAEFVPVFEKNGFISKLDMFMFEETCKFIRAVLDSGRPPLVISVNFSRQHLHNDLFVPTLCRIADMYKIPHKLLEIEITENAILEQEEILQSVLEKLHAENFTLSMDDFGIGYSSLGLLKNLEVDVIKIDRSFFVNAANSLRTKTVLHNVLKMAKDLGISTVAEGVEIIEHIVLLRELGCDIVQGYYYGKPMPREDFFTQVL